MWEDLPFMYSHGNFVDRKATDKGNRGRGACQYKFNWVCCTGRSDPVRGSRFSAYMLIYSIKKNLTRIINRILMYHRMGTTVKNRLERL